MLHFLLISPEVNWSNFYLF